MTNDGSASWVSRLERRLSKLADTASKESIQALAKWIGFRRTHIKEFAAALAKAIADPSSIDSTSNQTARQWLYLQIVHESIILDSGTSRWDRLASMREVLAESCMIEVAKQSCLDAATIKKVEGLIKQWDTLNVFGGPTLINVIKKQLTSASEAKVATPTAATSATPSEQKSQTISPAKETKPPVKAETVEPVKEDKVETPKEEPPSKPHSRSASIKSPKVEVEYDFESKNVPRGKVDSKDFLAPCKAIATLQIARDLRNDTAVQLSSLLKALPDDIKALCDEADEEVKQTGKPYQMKEDKARELSLRTSERLLDMDMEEQAQNIRTFMEIVEKQHEARQRIIHLLIRSRCQFGANEAAEAFYKLDDIMAELQKRKETLVDAMALEGLDFDEEDADKSKKKEPELAPLTWYKAAKENDGEPDAKRLKVEEE